MTPRIGRILGVFHHRAALYLAVMNPQQDKIGQGQYPPLEATMAAAGLEEMDTYIVHRQNTIYQYILTCSILELCLAEDWRLGTRVSQWWFK